MHCRRSIAFAFSTASGSTGGVVFECALVPGAPDQAANAPANASTAAYKPCNSPATFDGLSDGAYQFLVRAQGEQVADTRAFTKVCVSQRPPSQKWNSSSDSYMQRAAHTTD